MGRRLGPTGGGGRTSWWSLAVVVSVLAPALVLWTVDPRHFFNGDTQAAYLGWWHHLGEELRAGRWPLLDPHAWRAGNLAAEGQWGLFSPLVCLIAVASTYAGNVLVFASVVKLVLLCVGALGVFHLVRSYRVGGPWAYAAAVIAPLGGMSQYLDLPSWVAGLMIWALLPWVWWALRRSMLVGANPVTALALGYLLVTVGYVYGTVMLIVVLGVCLLDCRVSRNRAGGWRVLWIGAVCGLVAITVYLPGVLTLPVTIRGSGYGRSGKFASDVVAMFTSVLPSASVPGTTLHLLPYAYAAWVLPTLLWLDVDRARRQWRPLAGLLAVAVLLLLVMVGPGKLGPLRWPLRLQPFLVMALVVLWAVVMGRLSVPRPSARRLLVGLAWVAVAGVVAVLRAPGMSTAHVVSVVLVGCGIAALWLLRRRGHRAVVSALAVAVLSMALLAVQRGFYPESPSPDRNMPALAREYAVPLANARGDVLMVGAPEELLVSDPASVRDFLAGSAWYVGGHPVQNTYTTISFRAYFERYCIHYDGRTCPAALDTLFSREPLTGRQRVDLLGVSTVLLVRADFPGRERSGLRPAGGWRTRRAGR